MTPPDDEETGLPGLRNWVQVYAFVFVVLIVWVGLLTALTRAFS
jgi:hypothetical protein